MDVGMHDAMYVCMHDMHVCMLVGMYAFMCVCVYLKIINN